jgi:hypothetical protein
LYKDLEGKPIIPTVDSQLDPNSENPVQNKKVYEELNKKANTTDLENYVDSDELTEALRSK